MCIGKNNVYVIGKMIHKFCYSHQIMINTLYTCTVKVRVLYTVQVYSTECITVLFLGSVQFYLGGGACTLYSTECIIIFCSAQFYLGGLSPPSSNDTPPLHTGQENGSNCDIR